MYVYLFLLVLYRTFLVLTICFFFSSRRRHTRCALVTGVQTCALPICGRRWPATGIAARSEACPLNQLGYDPRQLWRQSTCAIFAQDEVGPREGVGLYKIQNGGVHARAFRFQSVENVAGARPLLAVHDAKKRAVAIGDSFDLQFAVHQDRKSTSLNSSH